MESSDFYRPKPPRSNRRYAKRICKNPECECDREFVPHDSRQLYCCYQCKVNFNNDRRKDQRENKFSDLKVLKNIDFKLSQMYEKAVDSNGRCLIHTAYFAWEGIDLSMLVRSEINLSSKKKIHWFFSYGIEEDVQNTDYIFIYKKR